MGVARTWQRAKVAVAAIALGAVLVMATSAIASADEASLSTNATKSAYLDGEIFDQATLAGTGNSDNAGGITFRLYGPDDENCSGPPIFTSAAIGLFQPVSSNTFRPTEVGTYRWIASYPGNQNTDPVSGECGDPKETSIVYRGTPALYAEAGVSPPRHVGEAVHGIALLEGFEGVADPTGSIEFRLYGPDDAECQETPTFVDTQPVNGEGEYVSAEFSPKVAGTYRWIASYSGDAQYGSASTNCNAFYSEVSVRRAVTSTSLSVSPTSPFLGGVVSFAAQVSGSSPTGTVSFLNGDLSMGSAQLDNGSASIVRSSLQPGTHSITAVYNGDLGNGESVSTPVLVTVQAPLVRPPVIPAPTVRLLAIGHMANPSGEGFRYEFSFEGNRPGLTILCRMDEREFRPCLSPKRYANLSRGRHVFRLKAVDTDDRQSAVRVAHFFAGSRP